MKSIKVLLSVMVLSGLIIAPLGAEEPGPAEKKSEAPAADDAAKKKPREAVGKKGIVVTETKIPQDVKTSTQKINVLSDEDIAKLVSSKNNLSELLLMEPGTAVNALSKNDANWGTYGGLGPKYNGYLLDGLPIDAFVDTMSIDPAAIKRAEIYRGPAAVLYTNYLSQDFAGNQSPLSGITNLVLKDRIDKPVTKLSAWGGSWWTQGASGYHEGSTGDAHYFFGANYEKSEYTNYGTKDSWLNMLDNPEYRKTKLYGKISYFMEGDQKLSVFAHHTQHNGDAGRVNRDYNHEYDTVNVDYSKGLSKDLIVQAKAGLRRYDRRWGEDNYPTDTDLELKEHDGVIQNIYPADLNITWRHMGESLLTVGADNQYGTYRTYADAPTRTTKNDATADNTGVYVQEKLITGDWIFRAGARFNYTRHRYERIDGVEPIEDGKEWQSLIWSAGARWNGLEWLSLYANGGSSFLAPGIKSIAGTIPEGSPLAGQLPNKDLKPESGMSYDAGMDFAFKRVTLGVRGFYTVIQDSIVDNVVSAVPSQTKSVNAGESTAYGAEGEIKAALLKNLSGFANYTYTCNNVKNSKDPDQNNVRLSFVPVHTANGGLSFEVPDNFLAALYAHYQGAIYDSTSKSGRNLLEGYTVLNAKLKKAFVTSSGTVNLWVDLQNLTNKKYEMPWGFQDPGFAAFARVELVL
jgi:iron complex outermembrane recepter protein